MSNRNQYLKFWQQKRSELQIEIEPQVDWLAMQHLLDQQMPVVNPNANHTNPDGNLVKQLSHFAKFKLIYIAAVLITSATIIYLVIQHRAATKNNNPAKNEVKADSILQNNQQADSTGTEIPVSKAPVNNGVSDKNIGNKNSNRPLDSAAFVNGSVNGLSRSGSGTNKLSGLPSSANKINGSLVLKGNKTNSHTRSNNNINGRWDFNSNNAKLLANLSKQVSGTNRAVVNSQNISQAINDNSPRTNIIIPQSWSVPFVFYGNDNLLVNNYTTAGIADVAKSVKTKNRIGQSLITKTTKIKTHTSFNLDWGFLAGVSIPSSFTSKNQNKNFYGSLPVDAYTGLFATYNISDKWAVDMQVKLLIPNKANETYNHIYTTKGDTGQTLQHSFKITDSRKIYSAQIPIHLVYNVTPAISVKAGPVINLPIKFIGLSTVNTIGVFKDTVGYINRLIDTVNSVNFEKKVTVGMSGGIGYNYKRIKLEATYYYNPQPIKISTPLRSYTNSTNNLQITLGFKLNKIKH